MKRLLTVLGCLLLFSCNSDTGWNCIKTVGTIVTEKRDVTAFSEILVEDDLFLTIEEGEDFSVTITSGENLIDDITVEVVDEVLKLNNTAKCNFNRAYDVSYVHVVTPTLTRVRSSSVNTVSSIGVLRFPEIRLISDTRPGVEDAGKSGDFNLEVNNETVLVSANGQNETILSGKTNLLRLSLLDEIPKVSAGNLFAKEITFYTRSANTITAYPVDKISGEIRGVGDVILKNKPPIVEVESFFTGQLIFE